MKFFKIIFDNPSESYFAGQVVSGKVHLHLSQAKRVKAVKLKIIGKGEAHWSKQKGKSTKYYDAEELYLNHEKILVEERSEETTIEAGNHIYDFHFALPSGIPSSFQAKKGWVQYYALATITKSWGFSKKTSSYFTVNGLVDLNTDVTASNPVGLNKTKTLPLWGCCGSYWCCTNSSVGFVLNLDKTGFVPGEVIKFSLVAFNQSEHRAKALKARIIQVATFHVRYHKRYDSVSVKELVGPTISPGGSANWEPTRDERLRVPAVPPTNLGGGTIISLDYFLEISLRVATCCAYKVEARVPIIIGTIPFRNTFEQFMPSSRFHRNPEVQGTAPAPNASPTPANDGLPEYGALAIPLSLEGYPDLPPPTYTEAMDLFDKYGSVPPLSAEVAAFEADDVDNHVEDNISEIGEVDEAGAGRPFLPRYATYDWGRV